jgi:eukaryotic-like serine/threonine-protein kinase
MADAKIPDIGKYRIIELVGEGAMGVVYRAVDTVLDRTVAIKVMNDSIARQDELRKRFLHEAQAAASLQHPNVVSIYDLGEVDGHLFIAMEFVQGIDLERLLESGEPLLLQQKLDITIDVLTGLTFAHKRGIVHRDIKPANIQVAEDGRAKIMDFGVAHLASSNLTATGASLGTPGYMAPEQIIEGKTTPATDVFAVGVVLYELLTRVKPFIGLTLQNLFFRIINDKPKPVSELVPGLPRALDRIVLKALSKEPSDRYATALEMATELTAVRSSLSGPSYPASVSLSATVEHAIAVAKKTSRTRTRHLSIAGGGVLVGVVMAGVVWSLAARARPETRLADGAPTSISATASGSAATPESSVVTRAAPSTSALPSSASPVSAPSAPPRETTGPPSPPRTARTEERPAATERPTRGAPAPRVAEQSTRPPAAAPPSFTTQPSVQPPASQPIVQQQIPAPPAAAAAAATVQAAPETTPPAPSAATAADLAPVIESYARAIESRDVSAIRRVYPALTSEQQRGFEQFFQSARKLNVTFSVTNVEGTGPSADARVTGSYVYESSSGKTERQPVSFAATLRRDGGAWRLVSLH